MAFARDITAYDGLYAALAQQFGCSLAIADPGLARAFAAVAGPDAMVLG